ncbi:hypothetical protein MATL_G00222400 [Megalops atlanticus]|uniref:Apin n=1 Tax=Megalops atlanticus TaxID=7932 RepID=A0A9D3PF35_MEGAT|nr:hypothetical protein MATL_G00222400 [Megalops atlanticus]
MKLHTVIAIVFFLNACSAIPILQQFGILASNSNELLRLNGLTFPGVAQATSFLPPYVIQQGADIGLPPQMVPFNPQVAGPFPPVVVPAAGNPVTPVLFPPGQQEQPQGPQGPQGPSDPSTMQHPQTPNQMFPQYYPSIPFPQRPGAQRYPYYFSYGYPQRHPTMVQQPTQGATQMNLEQTTQTPQLPLQVSQTQVRSEAVHVSSGKGTDPWTSTAPPDQHGDTPNNGIEESHPSFSFLFEP